MRLTLTRVERSPQATLGDLAIDGDFFCYTLEDPVRPEGIKIPGVTAIPAGVYPVQITWSPRFKTFMPLLVGVPNFSGIRIHPGNTADHTEGCILVGYERHPDEIRRSREAYNDLLLELQAAREAREDVMIEIRNAFEEA
jgi:hypothetical protein